MPFQTLVSSTAEAMCLGGLQSFGPADPFQLVKEEIDSVSERLRRSIFTGIPTLRSAAQYFFKVISVAPRKLLARLPVTYTLPAFYWCT